jgi:transposase-like protein
MNDGKQDGGRKRYDEAFKRSALELWQRGGKSASRVAAELGVNVQSLQQWRRQYAVVPPAGTERTVEALEAENRRLRRELALAFEQRDILKKTLGILSAPSGSAMNGSRP